MVMWPVWPISLVYTLNLSSNGVSRSFLILTLSTPAGRPSRRTPGSGDLQSRGSTGQRAAAHLGSPTSLRPGRPLIEPSPSGYAELTAAGRNYAMPG